MRARLEQGFSLIELAVVLAILGLLVGGVLVGNTMIRSARMNSVSISFMQYGSATEEFRKRFMAWPGDMLNATNYWGAADAGDGAGTDCNTTNSLGKITTCNGNGDGKIDRIYASREETYRAWQHLANAELINGKFSGICGPGCSVSVPVDVVGENIPASGIPNMGYAFAYRAGPLVGDAQYFDGSYQFNTLSMNKQFLTPEEAQSIDRKYDDGKPALGRLFVLKESSTWMPNCALGDTISATYKITNRSQSCALIFSLARK